MTGATARTNYHQPYTQPEVGIQPNPWVVPMVPWPSKKTPSPYDYDNIKLYTPPVESFTGANIKVELLVNGKSISELTHKGSKYFVASSTDYTVPYTIKITNSSGVRVAVVVSVDGLSVMNGKNATQNDTAYIVDAYGSTEIKGWRRGDSEVAQFLFTEKGGSYASLTDRPTNVGVIGVIAYPEKAKPQFTYRPAYAKGIMNCLPRGVSLNSCGEVKTSASIGTGYGDNIADKVNSVSFERDYTRKVVLVYNYDSWDSLVERGIIIGNPAVIQPIAKKAKPTPFPGDTVDNIFCPSPHSRW